MINETALERVAQPASTPRASGLHILVLHQHYWPEIAATAQILTDVCEDLARLGHRVTVVCGQPSYRTHPGDAARPTSEMHGDVSIERVWTYVPDKRSIPKRLLQYGSYFSASLARSMTRARPDVCLVMSTPPLLLGISGALLRALKSVPFVYSVQDLYPDIAVHLGVLPKRGATVTAIDQVAKLCYRSAAAVVTLSGGMADRLMEKGVSAERVHVVPNWADTDNVVPTARDNALARELGLAGGFVVQYSGNLGLSQGLEHVLDTAEEVADLPITFAFVGDGNAKDGLVRAATSRRLANVRFFPPQPRENLSNLLGACDVGLVTMRKGVGTDLVPSKLYGIMAAARPVLASVESHSEVARILRDCDCGWTAEAESKSALASLVRKAFEASPAERAQLGSRGRIACTTQFTRRALTKRYEEVLVGAARRKPANS